METAALACYGAPLRPDMYAPRHDSKPLNRLVNLLLLLGWLLSSQGVAPVICMAAALIDGDHHVKIGQANNGALTVVLSHEGKSAEELLSHQHDVLCRMLVAFAKAPSPNDTDHVLAFKQVEDAARAQRLASAAGGAAKTEAVIMHLGLASPFDFKACAPGSVPWQMRKCCWSQGVAMKAGRVVMRC